MVSRAAVLGAAAITVALLAGCVPSAPERPRPATAEEIAARQEQQARMWWESMSPGQPMPDVAVIEELPAELAFERQNDCLREANLPGVTVNEDSVSWTGSTDDGLDDPGFVILQQQQWICAQQYPAAGEDVFVLSEDELAWLYDYFSGRYRPCLASHGFDFIDFPGREVFIGDGPGYPAWVPHDYSVSPVPSPKDWQMLAARCPLPYLLEDYALPGTSGVG